MTRRCVCAGILWFLWSGCASDGALGQAKLTPDCAADDLVCVFAGVDDPLAAGSTLDLNLDLEVLGSAASSIELRAVDPTVLEVEGRSVTAMAEGVSAVLIRSDDTVLDFVHLWVADADRLGLRQIGAAQAEGGELGSRFQLLVGDELFVAVEAYAGAQRLLGSAETTWVTDTPFVTLLDEGRPSYRRIVARAPGNATLSVSAMGFERTLTVEVLP